MKKLLSVLLLSTLALSGCMVKAKGGGGKVQVNPGQVKVKAK